MEIPIFPLSIVFFPNVVVPLHIFEERYKLLMNRCIAEAVAFGIVLMRPGSSAENESTIHRVGVTARIVQVERFDDGRMNTLNAGEARFRIHRFTGNKPYWTADVEFFEDDEEAGEELEQVHREVVLRYRQVSELAARLKSIEAKEVDVPDSPVSLSYLVSYVLDMDSEAKQELLEMSSTVGRLKSLIVHLDETAARLKKEIAREAIAHKAKGNGHFGNGAR